MTDFRIGHGYDIHRTAAGRKLVLGGVNFDAPFGLDGHSDADALTHAICDALLGAAGLPDIGHQFPNTDPAYKDATRRSCCSASSLPCASMAGLP
jgi:2-C-methyl-D-erythritol 2,4-cyclodiphosphate synthase